MQCTGGATSSLPRALSPLSASGAEKKGCTKQPLRKEYSLELKIPIKTSYLKKRYFDIYAKNIAPV
jgi:hypothetical protein